MVEAEAEALAEIKRNDFVLGFLCVWFICRWSVNEREKSRIGIDREVYTCLLYIGLEKNLLIFTLPLFD